MVDRNGVGGPQGGCVGFDYGGQLEPLAHLGQDRHAELPPPVGDHEVDQFGGGFLRRGDEIPFVFSIFGIDNDDRFTASNGCDGIFDGGETRGHGQFQ